MKEIELKVGQDHVESLAKLRNPLVAVEELVWNSLDADATSVEVVFTYNDLGGLSALSVVDNGSGIAFKECERVFGSLGDSTKKALRATPGGRTPHGKNGKGRFRAFGLGSAVSWKSTYRRDKKLWTFEVSGNRDRLRRFQIDDEETGGKKAGVIVSVTGIEQNFPSLIDASKAASELSRRLALYLRQYPGIRIKYDGIEVNPAELEAKSAIIPLVITDDGIETQAQLEIIEWKISTDRALYFCDESGFAFEERPPGIQAPGFHFTAYLKSSIVPKLVEDGAFALQGLHPVVEQAYSKAKEALKKYFREREAARSVDLVKLWKKEKVYPYESPADGPVKQAEREVFDICAVTVNEYLPDFEKADTKSKRLTFKLIREALEHSPDSLQAILRQVLELPSEQQNELAKLLERTKLAAIINASATVFDRLDFITSLDHLVFGTIKKTLLERTQLHRILVRELWFFGEQYSLGIDDESLASLLRRHIEILGRTDLAVVDDGVVDLNGKDRKLDLMLYQRYPQPTPNHFEHLVIELKRPSCNLGQEEFGQIENYALTIADDERFDRQRTKWTFYLIGNDLTKFGEQKCQVQGKEFGHIYASADGSVNIYVKTWATLIAQAKWRYHFFRQLLEYQVLSDGGMSYLKSKHAEYLPEPS